VTDVMQLKEENRVLEQFGLKVLNKTRRVGLQELCKAAGLALGELDTTSIGFQIGPRLNAAGRMNHANDALNLLIEEDPYEARILAEKLHMTNQERQKASEKMYKEAKEIALNEPDGPMIMLAKEGWSPGLVGLVAGKLVRDFYKPVYIVGKIGDEYIGSGRSIEGFDVTKTLWAAEEHLSKFGGHPEACGFSAIGEENFSKAKAAMMEFAEKEMQGIDAKPSLRIDAELSLSDINWPLQEQLEAFAPFGNGNPKPLFLTKRASVMSMKAVGNEGKHLKLAIRSAQGGIFPAIGFGFGEWAHELSLGDMVDVVYDIGVNAWNGSKELQLRIEDLKRSD